MRMRKIENMSFHSQRWENIGVQVIHQDHWSFHLYLSQCHLLFALSSLQKVMHRQKRETTKRPIPRTPSWRTEGRLKLISNLPRDTVFKVLPYKKCGDIHKQFHFLDRFKTLEHLLKTFWNNLAEFTSTWAWNLRKVKGGIRFFT